MVAAPSRPPVDGRCIVNPKIHVQVRIDLDGTRVRLLVRGEVTAGSVQALYVLARRANSLMPGLALMIDISRARVAPDALEELHACSAAAHLPVHIDMLQSECQLIILDPGMAAQTRTVTALAA